MRKTYVDIFWDKAIIHEDGCWEWKDRPYSNGYPYVQSGRLGFKQKASRVSFFIHNGFLPEVVRHDCDNPICTNPQHLSSGTQWDNVNDRRIRGRAKNQNTNKTHCINGHEFNDSNTYIYTKANGKTSRTCKPCQKARRRGSDANED